MKCNTAIDLLREDIGKKFLDLQSKLLLVFEYLGKSGGCHLADVVANI